MVFIMTNRFRDEPQYSNSATIELQVPTDSTDELFSYALRRLGGIYKKGFRYYRAGIILMDLVPADQIQTDLFDVRDRKCGRTLMRTLDTVNAQMGAGTLTFGAAGIQRP
jgi:DNA polymerase V